MKRSVFQSDNLVISVPSVLLGEDSPLSEPVNALTFARLYQESQFRLAEIITSWYTSSCWGMYLAVFPASEGRIGSSLEAFARDEAFPAMAQRNFVYPEDGAAPGDTLKRSAVLLYGHETRRIRDGRTFRSIMENRFRELGIAEFAWLSFATGKISSGFSGEDADAEAGIPLFGGTESLSRNSPDAPARPQHLRYSGILMRDLLRAALGRPPFQKNARNGNGIKGFDMFGKTPEAPLALMLFQKLRDLGTWSFDDEPEAPESGSAGTFGFAVAPGYFSIPGTGCGDPKPWDFLPDTERGWFAMACTVIGSQTWRAEDCYRKFLNTPELMEKLPVKFVSLDDLDPGLWPEFCLRSGSFAECLFRYCRTRDPDLNRKIARSRAAAMRQAVTGAVPDSSDPLEEIPASWRFRARTSFRISGMAESGAHEFLDQISGEFLSGNREFAPGTDGIIALDYDPARDYSAGYRDDPYSPCDIADLTGDFMPGYAALHWFFLRIMLLCDKAELPEFVFAFNSPWNPETFICVRYHKLSEGELPEARSAPDAWFSAFRVFRKRISFFNFGKGYRFTYRAGDVTLAPGLPDIA